MPLYEYQCRSCGERSEVLQRFSDDPLTTCETCGGELKKLVSAPAVQFKGEGWYVTDYAGKGKDKGGGSKSKDGESGGSSDSGGGESTSSAKESSGGSKSDSGSSTTKAKSSDS